jgi:long-chain acyl-CoA synthetase
VHRDDGGARHARRGRAGDRRPEGLPVAEQFPFGLEASRDRTFAQLLELRAQQEGGRVAVSQQQADGSWRDTTWAELRAVAAAFGSGLLERGIGRGDRVGLLLRPRVEGIVALLAVQGIGATAFPIYPTTPAETVEYLVELAEGKLVVDDEHPWAETLAAGRARRERVPDEWEQLVAEGRGDDTWTIYFTSGTTGRPKGVPLSDRMILTAAYFDLFSEGAGLLTPPGRGDRTFHEIPLASVAGPPFAIYYGLVFGSTSFIPYDPSTAEDALRHARPTFFLTFPRMWELRMSEARADKDGKRLYDTAMRIREAAAVRREQGRRVPLPLRAADALALRLVCRPLLARWGFQDLRLVWTGGATLPPDLIRQWRRWGVVIRQIYGQTESGGMATIQAEPFPTPGFAGRPGPRMELRVSDDGEILLRGEGVFHGYLNLPEATAAALDADGWFYTGDAGVLDPSGNLRVLDRKSDLIVLESGRTIVGSEIENVLKESRYIRNAVVAAGGTSDVVGLVELDDAAAREWARRNGVAASEYEGLARAPEIVALVEREVDAANERLAAAEQALVSSFRLLPVPIDLDDPAQATPTRKVRRAQLAQKYQSLVEEMRAG